MIRMIGTMIFSYYLRLVFITNLRSTTVKKTGYMGKVALSRNVDISGHLVIVKKTGYIRIVCQENWITNVAPYSTWNLILRHRNHGGIGPDIVQSICNLQCLFKH